MQKKTHTIDAAGIPLGRLAVQISNLLRGKHKPEFVPYKDTGDFVVVKNIKKIKFTGKKMEKKKYYHHSGYLGGLKEMPLKRLFQKNPQEVLRRAVFGMLPNNRLRSRIIKKLRFK